MSSIRQSLDLTRLNYPQGPYTQLEDLLAVRFLAESVNLAKPRLARSQISGNMNSRRRGRGMEFEEVRQYQAGDDIRTIDWRVTARTQIPHTKLFQEEKERPLLLMVDQRASMFFGSKTCFKSVTACHLAAALAWAGLAANDRVGGLIFSGQQETDCRPKRGRQSVMSLIKTLSGYNHALTRDSLHQVELPLSQRLRDLRRITKPGSGLYIISDFHDFNADCQENIFHLRRHADISLIHIYDELEHHFPRHQRLAISNGIQQRMLDTADQVSRDNLEKTFEQRQLQLEQCARQLAIPLFSAASHEGLGDVLARLGTSSRKMR